MIYMDDLSREQRMRCMQANKRSGTKPEAALIPLMPGFEYQPKGLPGHPDFADRTRMTAVFIDGCFWHGCPMHFRPPKTNADYWRRKIQGNIERDSRINQEYASMGWRVVRIFEHEIKGGKPEDLRALLEEKIGGR